MRIGRTLPPAAAPLDGRDIAAALAGFSREEKAVIRLMSQLKVYFGTEHVFPVSSGKAALTLGLRALARLAPAKNEVIVPAYTCYSVPSAVVKAGLKIVPCDLDPRTFDFNHEHLVRLINPATLCVMPTHLFGIPADVDAVVRLRSREHFYIIEDAAQGMGVEHEQKFLGTRGDIGVFSLGRGKNITSGSGGLIITGSDEIAGCIKEQYSELSAATHFENMNDIVMAVLLVLFLHPLRYWIPANLPFLGLGKTVFYDDFPLKKLSYAKAGLLQRWRETLENQNRVRAARSAFYIRKGLGSNQSEGVPYLRFPVIVENPIKRNALVRASAERGLGISLMYPAPVHRIDAIRHLFPEEYPAASMIAECLVTLPTHSFVTEDDQQAICELMRAALPDPSRRGR